MTQENFPSVYWCIIAIGFWTFMLSGATTDNLLGYFLHFVVFYQYFALFLSGKGSGSVNYAFCYNRSCTLVYFFIIYLPSFVSERGPLYYPGNFFLQFFKHFEEFYQLFIIISSKINYVCGSWTPETPPATPLSEISLLWRKHSKNNSTRYIGNIMSSTWSRQLLQISFLE